MFHAIVLSFITLTAHRAPVKLPAVTVSAAVSCAAGEKYDVRDPFTGRSAYFCAASTARVAK